MNKEEMKKRTKQFGLRAIRLCEALPDTPVARVIRNQLLRCGTSVGANYRAACRAKSKADFISKMGTVEEETDESMYWMELIIEAVLLKEELITDFYQGADDLISTVVSSIQTAKRRIE
jgi:four helix bundle protein